MPIYQYNNKYYDIPSDQVQEFEAEFPDATVDVFDGNGKLYGLPVAQLKDFKKDYPNWSYSPISPVVADSAQYRIATQMAENLQDDTHTDATLPSPSDTSSPSTRRDATLASPDTSSPSTRRDATLASPNSQQFSTLDQAPEDTRQWLDEQKKQRQNKLNSQSITDSNVIGEQKKQLQQKYKDILDAQPAPHPFNTQPFGSNLPKDATYYTQAIAMLDDAQHTLDTARKIPNSNPIQNFGRGAARGLFNMNTLTLGLNELFTNTTLLGILDKADSKGIEALSDAEEALINAAIVKQVVDNSTDLGRSYLLGRGFTENLPYMIEFAISGIPAGALTKGASKKITNVMAQLARKAAEKTTSRFMRAATQQGTKFATGLAKGSLRAAAQLPLQSSTYNTLAERKIGQLDYADDAQGNLTYVARENEDTPEALAKTVASAFTTNLVETFGGNVIADLASIPIRNLANSKAWQSLSRSLRQNKLVQFAQAAGYQGAPVEVFEEMIDSSLNAIITGDQSLADVYSPDNIINTVGVTLLTSLFIGSAAGITTSRTRSRVNREYTQASNDIVNAGYTPTQIEQLTDIALGTPTQVSNWLAGINNEINTLIQQSSTDGSLDDNQSSTNGSLDDSAQSAQRIRQLISQRDFVLASAQYQALIGGMRDNIRPAIDAATQAINAQAHEQSGYTIKVFINNKALNGYLHSGNLDVTTLPDGTPQVNLNANIYQVAVPRDNGEIDIIQATPQDIVIQQAVPTETVLRQGLDAINQPLNDIIAQDLQQAVEQQQTPQTVGEGVNQDDASSPSTRTDATLASPTDTSSPSQDDALQPSTPTDISSLSDTDFDAHIDSLTPTEAISAIANRRGADDADQYATWKKAALTKQRDAAQKKLTRDRKPFDASRYPSFNEMKAAERQYNTQIEQEKQTLNEQIATLNAQLADIEAYLIDRNKQIAAEREAENPLQGGIAQAVRKQPINTLEQYIAREIALGARLRLSDNTGNGLAAELGITPGSQEHRELLSILSNTDGLTPEQWAEYIIENIEPEYAHLINGRDTQDIRNAIIDTIHAGVTSRRRAYQFIADINQQQADAERQYYENAQHNADTDTDATLASTTEGINQADIDADAEQAIREYEELLLSSLSPDDIAIIDAMTGDYWDELQAIYQYEQEAYNNYDTNSTRPTPQDNLAQRENATIQPSQETSNTTPVRQLSHNDAEIQPQSTAPAYPRSTRTDVVDTTSSQISNNFNEKIAQASADVNTNPTTAQKEAGNYKKGHVKIGSFDITIEQPKGSVRSGVDADGNKWQNTMQNTYGYIRGTEGVDGDHIDVFLSNDLDSWNGRRIYVVDQYNKDGSFDEHKVMLGFNDSYDAEEAYTSNYNKDWQGQRAISSVSLEDFEKWLASSHRKTKPFAEYKSVKTTTAQADASPSQDVALQPSSPSSPSTRTDATLASPTDVEVGSNHQPIGKNILGNLYNQFRGKAQDAINFLLKRGEGNAIAALHHKDVGDIDIWYGNEKAGLKKIALKHPEVLQDLQGVIDNMHVTKASENRIILESESHRAIISKMLGNEKTDNWLLSAYELRSTPVGSSDIDTEPIGMQNGTAALHSTSFDDKDNIKTSQSQDITQLSDTDFDAHIDSLTPAEAISAIALRRGDDDADQYATWKKAALTKQRDAAQKKLTRERKPFDASRYPSFNEMKAAGGNTYWAERISSEENKLALIERDIQEEKINLQKKGVNVDEITRQTEQAQKAIEQINEKIENLKDFKESLADKYRKEREVKEKSQGDVIANYINERKAENNSGFYKIRPQQTSTDSSDTPSQSSDIPERIRDKFSFRELDDTTNSSSNSNWSPEEQSIIDQARDNGTYLLAPNGRPTNLTPRQWVQVRTKAFKQWFGDWQKAARIEKLRNSTPVSMTGNEYKGKYELNRDSAQNYILNNLRGYYDIADTKEHIKIAKKGAKKVTSHSMSNEVHLKSIAIIPEIINSSVFITELPAEKNDAQYDSYRYYVCGLDYNGESYTVKMTIGVKNGDFYYDHALTEVEKGKLLDLIESNQAVNREGFTPTGDAPIPSYALSKVKDSKLLSILQTNASKIVDSNGEPRVMYHGTDADITTFLMQDGSLGRGAYFTSNWDEAAEYAKSKQGVEDIEDLDENKVLEVFLNVRDESNITHSRFYREDIEVLATTPNQIKSATDNIGSFDNRSSDIRFRSSSPLDVAQQVVAQDMPRRIAKRAKQLADRLGVDITIINSNDELRQINDDYAYLADWIEGKIDGQTRRYAGFFSNDDKRIIIFSNVIRNLQDPLAEVEKTITHEVVAHYGLRRLLGEEGLANFLSDVWQSLPTEKQLRWGKYAMNIKRTQTLSPTELAMLYSDKQLQQKAAEEYIANISEQGVTTPTLWQRICAAFRRIMRRLGFYNYTPTEADIRYILARSYNNLRRDAGSTDAGTASQAVGEGGNPNLSTVNFQSREVNYQPSTNSQEDAELIEAAITRFSENFNTPEIIKVENLAHLRDLYSNLTDKEFKNLFKEYKKVGAMYDAELNKIFIFAENSRNAYTELVHEATHAAIQKLYNSENLADKLDTFIKEIEKLQPEGCNMVAEIYSGDDYINEIVAYTLCGYIHNSSIEKLKEQLSPEAQQELLPILNEIGYETGRKQHTKEYTRIFDTSRARGNNSILPRTPRANQGNSSGVISQDARITSQTRKQQTIADNTLSTLDDIAEQYNQHLDEQRQAFADAITPQPTDDPITTAQKVRFREVAEFVTRDNTAYEQFLDVANDISDAINENDARHGRKRTAVAESHYDSMQRLKNLIDDIGTKQTNNNPYITQNQARSRAQALTRIFNATHLPEIYDAVTNCLQALNPNIDWKNKDQVDEQYNRLSIYLQARTALERQAIKEEAARAEAKANGEEYIERDFAGLAGVQTAIFDLYDQYDETVKAVKRDREKLAALAQDREVPTVQEFVESIEKEVENYAGNNQSPINSLWKAIQKVSEFQLDTSYEAGVISRSGYQTLTYGVSIDNLLKQRYEEQRKAIIDHPGNYDNVTDYDKDGNATGTRKQLNSKAQQDLYNLANEYAEAVKQVPMPTNTQNDFQRLIETGWLTAEEVASFHRYYQYYTPLKGHAELTAEDVVEYEQKTPRNQSKVKSVQGHTQLAKDPLNQLILDTHGAIQSAEQNRWRRDLYNLLSRNPNSKQYAIQQRYYRVETNINGDKEFVPYGTIERDELGEEIFVPGVPTPEELANGTAVAFNNRNTEAKVDIPIRRSQHDEHTVTVLVDGEPYSIFFYDKRIADAVNGRNIKHPRDIWRALEKLQGINRLYAGLKTSLNPTFTLISNLPRDWAEMTSNNFIAHGAQHALTSFIYRLRATWMGDVQRAVMRYQSGELVTIDDAKTETERYVMEFITNGGQVNITQLPDYEDARVNLAKDLQYFARKGEMPKGNILARLFNDMAERVELAPRLATYIASRKIGLSIAESINDAKEATVNFDRKGSWSGIMGLFQLFYNASAQSVRRQIQLAKQHPIRFTATYAVIGLTTTINNIMIGWLLSSLLAGDDEDKKHSIEDIATKYFAVNPELRRHYNVIMLGDTYIRIPMAINYLPYVTLGDVLADTFLNPNSRKQHLKNTLDVTSAILDTFSPSMIAQPIGFAFDAITARDNRVKESAIQAMTMSALNKIPVLEPLVQSFGNYNFMGGTLYDTPFNRNSAQPAYIEARAYTQPIWILASRTLNDITGGNEVRAGWANIPAESIENVMSIFGGFGEYGENIASLAQLTYEAATGSEVKASDWIKSSPLISRLYGGNVNERYDKAMQSLFYDDMSALAKFNEYRKNADTPELMEDFNREYTPDEQRYFADLNTMQRIHNILKREERAKQNAAASDLASLNSRRDATQSTRTDATRRDATLASQGDHSNQQQALYELANTQFQSLASGDYQPVNDPYYKYMYLLDAIRNTPYTTQAGEVVNIGSLNKSERKQLLKNDKEMLDMLNLLDDVKEDFADIDKKYYPGKQLNDKQQRLYDQRLPRIVRRTKQLTEKYNQLNNNKSR